ncbi:bleomycin hydrolase [Mucilaginibacter frigoritolerans]|uniref:Bleomycin hydrolase n=1 Tax=Mucilaginibacter frigoritolerans TaxID=652788 RepID=A0A562TR75_9SPHI|nr:C1 family peptidase [Mucilaginibacter frigoritolerans]TWI95973.1 bleomycin hydrolase [Mucilaginibacter frigoritolerans]
MKAKIFLVLILVFSGLLAHSQESNPSRLRGSWLGTLPLPNGAGLRFVMHFKTHDKNLTGTFDVPEQVIKDGFIDSVWIAKDSVFADFTTRIGKGAMYKGVFLPGDSVIQGNWIQGGSHPLNLKPTTYIYTQKSNLNPKFDGYKIVKLIESTPTKDQQNTGTCWSHATTSFIETEAMRLGKSPVVLSPMYFVIPTLIDKAEKYIRMQGNLYFIEGDLTFSALKAYKEFGAIPEDIYSGKIDNSSIHEHLKMENTIREKLKSYVDAGRGNMTPEEYRASIAAIIYKTMTKAPQTFNYDGKVYTPKSFAEEKIGINTDNYIEITSYTHHPFYSKFALEIPSNWNNNAYLNVPITDFISIIDHALLNNYSVCWDGDIDEGYNNGFCKLEKNEDVTQLSRQAAFDNYTTQDDHNMHIIGIAEDNQGKRFYIVKNSSTGADCGGYVYMSKEYLLLKTISVMVHKDAIPVDITKKLKAGLL